jgi:hypothetical protein
MLKAALNNKDGKENLVSALKALLAEMQESK